MEQIFEEYGGSLLLFIVGVEVIGVLKIALDMILEAL